MMRLPVDALPSRPWRPWRFLSWQFDVLILMGESHGCYATQAHLAVGPGVRSARNPRDAVGRERFPPRAASFAVGPGHDQVFRRGDARQEEQHRRREAKKKLSVAGAAAETAGGASPP